MERLRPAAQPGFLVPVLLAATLAADVSLRLTVPLELVSYRVWEALRAFGAETPFRPNARYDRPRVYGNLAALGNQRDLRQYHRVVFTTDSLGYHNPPHFAAGGDVAALLFGSSFSAGTEVSDGEDLAPQLSSLVGRAVYNAAPGDPFPSVVVGLARRLGITRGVVLYEYHAGTGPPPLRAAPPALESAQCRRLLGPWSTAERCVALTRLLQRLRISPLGVFARRLQRRVQDDRWLPNAATSQVLRARLSNGAEMLFLAGERERARMERWSDATARHGAWLAQQLAADGFALLVVLMPEKYTVYGGLLARRDTTAGGAALARVEQALRARGVVVVNLTEPLRRAARDALANGGYVFWRDDTHWNAAGVRVAAQAIAPALRALLDSQRARAAPGTQ